MKRPIKILFTIPNFDTAGSGKALLNIASRLNTDYFEAHIACLHDQGEYFNIAKSQGIPLHVFKFSTQMRPLIPALFKCFKARKKLKEINPDIIHSFHYAADYSEPLAAKLAGIKWIYTKKNMNWGGRSKNGWHLRTFLANKIVVQNTDMNKQFFPKSKKTTLIARGVNTKLFKPDKPKISLKNLWVDETDRIVICVANLVPVKGIEILIQAFQKIHHNFANWKLLIVGDNNSDYGLEMKKLTQDLKINNKVIFTGKQNNIVDFLNLAEIAVLPTLNKGRKEGSPVALLEAMSCSKVVLGSNISGINDQLSNFPDYLIEAGNVTAWSQALSKQFLNTTSDNEKIGQQFRQHVIDKFTIENEVEKTQNLYFRCLKVHEN